MRRLRGISRREFDSWLGKSEGYMAQVFGGFVGLRFKLLLDIAPGGLSLDIFPGTG